MKWIESSKYGYPYKCINMPVFSVKEGSQNIKQQAVSEHLWTVLKLQLHLYLSLFINISRLSRYVLLIRYIYLSTNEVAACVFTFHRLPYLQQPASTQTLKQSQSPLPSLTSARGEATGRTAVASMRRRNSPTFTSMWTHGVTGMTMTMVVDFWGS